MTARSSMLDQKVLTSAGAQAETPATSTIKRSKQWRPLRLAYLTSQYPKVSHTFIRRELCGLERRGHNILRLAIRPGDSTLVDPADLAEAERTIQCLGQSSLKLLVGDIGTIAGQPVAFGKALQMAIRAGWRTEKGIPRYLAYLAEAAWMLRVLRQHRIEHVHVHFGRNAAAVARMIRRLGGPPYSFTVHGPDELDSPRSWRLGELQEDASFVVAITDYCAAQLRRWVSPEHWAKIHVVRCAVGDQFMAERTPVDNNSREFLCVGRLCPQKAQLLLVEAMGRLRQHGHQCKLTLAGDGEMRPIIEKRIEDLGLIYNVRITGWIGEAQVRELIKSSRVMVLPSFAEGLPIVLMEAMAMGRPVISTYIAGIPELVQHGHNGWLVPAGNVAALAEVMAEALITPAERLTLMGAAGADAVGRLHDAATQAEHMEALFLSATKHHA